jgi:glycosyltransferase involved in cell wall biosynthesis
MIGIYFILFTALLLFYLFGFWVRWQWNQNFQERKSLFIPSEISVIIPFRNETENLPQLIESINNFKTYPKEIIFVNDHSEDDFALCFEKLQIPIPFTILNLKSPQQGKKSALRLGIDDALGAFILTWDADIKVSPNYFTSLSKVPKSDLLILPVSMPGKTLQEIFFELDYQYLNALNAGISGNLKPIVASGANLLFNKEIFLEIDSIESHIDVPSGDDAFLLQDFKLNDQTIELAFKKDLIVETDPPSNWNDFFQQRLRWIGKSSKVNDRSANIIGILGMMYHLGFWLLFMTDISWSQLVWLTVFKVSLDFLVFAPYLSILRRKRILFLVLIFSILYPIYMLMILVTTLFYEPEWKGRSLSE